MNVISLLSEDCQRAHTLKKKKKIRETYIKAFSKSE